VSNAVPFEASAALLASLEQGLAQAVRGEIRFDAGSKAVYASDASNYRQVPLGVVVPRDAADMAAAVDVCRRHDVPFLTRGGGTSQNGQCVNVAVVADTSKFFNRVVSIDPREQTGIVEPGVVCDTLRDAAAKYGLTFAPDPATHSRCTLGGMIANNSCGAHSVMAGKTVENVEALEVLTYDGARFWVGPTSESELARIIEAGGRQGEIYGKLRDLRDRYAAHIRKEFPAIKRRVSGFNLDQLLPENGFNVARALVGTEGTCAITLQAKVRLVHSPAVRVILVLGFTDIYEAADAVPYFSQFSPIAIEGLDRQIIRGLQARGLKGDEIALLPGGDAWVVLEFGGETVGEAVSKASLADAYFTETRETRCVSTSLVSSNVAQAKVWSIRETGASAVSLSVDAAKPDPMVGWEDAAVDPLRLGDYLRAFQKLVDRYEYETCLYGHFGDGCVHARITFDLRSVEGVTKWRRFLREAAHLVVEFGGSLSGEHGDGQAKAEFLPIMYGPEVMRAFDQFKAIWDPANRLNPGKVVNAYRADENLRMGPDYKPVRLSTRLAFKSREGDGMQRAVERCIGMGKCRSAQGGTMCPSYRVTKEEKFSTRGRAHLLWEMLQGEVITDGWRSQEVKEALDACLACKGCRSECPTHTDMASYKAEFLSHFYEHERRPRQAWFFGRIGQWAPFAARLPGLVNAVSSVKPLAAIGKKLAGIAPERSIPAFAPRPFSRSAKKLRTTPVSFDAKIGKPVILWVDTFNEHFSPHIANAAFTVLSMLEFDVIIPRKRLCCGRPLYDYGLLDEAKALLETMVDDLAEYVSGNVPIVGLEPGCLSVFKDELLKQLPDNHLAKQLSENTHLFSNFLAHQDVAWPKVDLDVVVHGHCHQKSIFGMAGETSLLDKLGARWTLLDAGCCGMAGAFGFNKEHYAMSMQIGEAKLLPLIREVPKECVVVTNGFSCKEQISHGSGRETMHIAELVWRALTGKIPMLLESGAAAVTSVEAWAN
jgi:FAD/FMN-containing dehydrogenase/Fe-S oxidoreductase